METKQSISKLYLSVNAVLDVTPRKIGKLGWELGKAIWDKATNREVKQLRQRITQLEAMLADK